MAHPLRPLFDLEVRTPRLVLRVPTDDDFLSLLAAVRAGIHDPAEMPFARPWTDTPEPQRTWSTVGYLWRARADVAPAHWDLPLAVFAGGELVGVQALHAREFPVLREVVTGSWLTRSAQGRGIGTEMRSAAVHLAFAGLGAQVVRSAAFADNEASIRVSEKVGYEPDGTERKAPRGVPRLVLRFCLTRERWASLPRPPVEVRGLEGCLGLLGLGGPEP
jgi:RimJ/RimL family protein N-acetyltransferase